MYKRQGYLSGEETGLRRTTVGVIRKLQTMTDEDFDRLDLDPVSYTHLDVYKRQTSRCRSG